MASASRSRGVLKKSFRVWIIPHTHEITALRDRKLGDAVNLEPDLLGKYVEKFSYFVGAAEKKPELRRERKTSCWTGRNFLHAPRGHGGRACLWRP